MPNLSQIELQNLRHLIGAHETSYQKLNSYSSEAVDPQSNPFSFVNAINLSNIGIASSHCKSSTK